VDEKDKDKDKALKDALESLEMADSCLGMIRRSLEDKGISMEQCPPMFYPEAIHNLAVWTAKASRDCWRDHQWHNEESKAFADCMTAGIKHYAVEAEMRFKAEAKKEKAP
jgi:hypothetical protein